MKLVEARQKIGKATQTEYFRAKLDRDVAASEYAQRIKIARTQ